MIKKLLYTLVFCATSLASYAQGYDIILDGKSYNISDGTKFTITQGDDNQMNLEFMQDGELVILQGKEIKFKGDIEVYFQQLLDNTTKCPDDNYLFYRPDCFGYGAVMVNRDAMTADVKRNNTGYNWFRSVYENRIVSTHITPYFIWKYFQNSVFLCNLLINKLEAIVPRTDMQEYYLAIAYTYRAFAYLDMARMYEYLPCDVTQPHSSLGHDITNLTVPIVTTAKTLNDIYEQPRATRQEMYEFILQDLDMAQSGITKSQRTDKRLPNLATVLGLKARLYMWVENYVLATQAAKDAISTGEHSPLTKEELLDIENGFNSLAPSSWIWGAVPRTNEHLNSWPSWMCNGCDGYTLYAELSIPPSLYRMMGNRDIRKQLFKVTGEEPAIKDDGFYESIPTFGSLKFRAIDKDEQYGMAAYPLMRIEEMYLIQAEATAHLSSEAGKALLEDFVRTYRDPDYRCPGTTSSEVVQAIFNQKRIELWGEGQIFFDYKRLNIPVDRTIEDDSWDNNFAFKTTTRPAWMNYPFPQLAYSQYQGLLEYDNPISAGLYLPGGGFEVSPNETDAVFVDGAISELLHQETPLIPQNIKFRIDQSGKIITLIKPFAYLPDSVPVDSIHQLDIYVQDDNTLVIPQQATGVYYKGKPLYIKSTKNGVSNKGTLVFPRNGICLLYDNEIEVVNSKEQFIVRLSYAPKTSTSVYIKGSFYPGPNQWETRYVNGEKQIHAKFYVKGLDEVRLKLVPDYTNQEERTRYQDSLILDKDYGSVLDADTAAWFTIPGEENDYRMCIVGIRNGVVEYTGTNFITNLIPSLCDYSVSEGIINDSQNNPLIKLMTWFHGYVKQAYITLVKDSWTDEKILDAWNQKQLDEVYPVKMTYSNFSSYAFLHYPFDKEMSKYRIAVIGQMQDGSTQVLKKKEGVEWTKVLPDPSLHVENKVQMVDSLSAKVDVCYSFENTPAKLTYMFLPANADLQDFIQMPDSALYTYHIEPKDTVHSFSFYFLPTEDAAYCSYLVAYDKEGNYLTHAVTTPLHIEDMKWTPWCATKDQWEKAGLDGNDFPFPDCTGTCTYTYTKIFGGDDSGLPFYYRQNLLDPTIGEIRIDSWCYGVTLILNFNPQTNNIQIEPQFTGYTNSEVGDFYITDVSHWQNKDYYASYPCTFDPVTGRIVLNTAWMAGDNHASCYGYGEEYIQLAGYYVPDYSVETSYCGVLTDASGNVSAQLSVSITGQDVAKLVGVVMEGDADVNAVAEAIKAGELEATVLENGYNNLAIGDKTGNLQVVVVVFDAEDNIRAVKSSSFEYYADGKSPWKSLGKGYFTDDAVLTIFFNVEAPAYEVEIQEHTEKPGYYRLVDPYTEGVYPYTSESLGAPLAPAGKYLYVDATDPEAVFVEEQELGMDWGYGTMTLQSVGYEYLAYYGPDMFETIKSMGYFGSVNEGVISFPLFEGVTYNYQWQLGLGDSYYQTGEKISIVLPSAPATVKAACKTRAKGTMRLARANGKTRKQAGKSLRFPMLLKVSLKN